MALMEENRKQWILETVDLLRQRKARPDFVRISRMLARYHGVTLKETRESLESLVNDGKVHKVHFKGNVSYRRKGKGPGDQNDGNKTSAYNHSTSNRIMQAIRTITKQTGDGVTFAELERWLISKNPDTRLVKLRLHTALLREMESNNVTKLSDNCFVLTESLPKSENPKELKQNPAQLAPNDKPSKSTSVPETKKNNSAEASEKVNKRGRPLSKRKKIKKTHGPDFENPLKLRSVNKENKSEDPTCDFCSCSAKSNREGVYEQLLTCKDCNAKVHPSCMDYSQKLAERALNSPWQCMDCKTCCVCDGEGSDDLIVFCDECDKGYHLTCHSPPLAHNPKGTWICCACKKLSGNVNQEKINHKTSQKREVVSEGEDENGRKGGKRKLSRQKSSPPELKRQKSSSLAPDGTERDETFLNSTTDGTEGASCLPTPSASPRPGDTFDYEMKMSLLGKSLAITEDNTVYSDASCWTVDDVVDFFKDNGHPDQAHVFLDQEIDGPSLLLLKREDVLTVLGLRLGPALKIYQKVLRLQQCSSSVTDT